MFVKYSHTKQGRIQAAIVRGFRDETGRTRQTVVQWLGYLDEIEKEHPNAKDYCNELAKSLNEKAKTDNPGLFRMKYQVCLDESIEMETGKNNSYNFGYVAFSKIYHELGIHEYFNRLQPNLKIKYNLNSVFRGLTFSRIISPCSKMRSYYDVMPRLFERTDFELEDVYRSLKFICEQKDGLIQWINDTISKQYDRDLTRTYYDLTNYYFEIDVEDDFRRKGVSKENSRNPIVQMGLLIDNNHIPLGFDMFPGNTGDSTTLLPMMNKAKAAYKSKRTIAVADKGIISQSNIAAISEAKDGYIFSQAILKSPQELKDYVLCAEGYHMICIESSRTEKQNKRGKSGMTEDDDSVLRVKSRIIDYEYKKTDGTVATVKQKQVILYSRKYAERTKEIRNLKIKKLKDRIEAGQYHDGTQYGGGKYIETSYYNINTGEALEVAKKGKKKKGPADAIGMSYSINMTKVEEDAQYDGYYAIVTSEVDLEEKEVISAYHELHHIEDSFKIEKSDFMARPVFVNVKEHIIAHFFICYVALLLERLLEMRLKWRYPSSMIIESTRNCNCCCIAHTNIYQMQYFDDVLKTIGEEMGINFSQEIRPLERIKDEIAKAKIAAKSTVRRKYTRKIKPRKESVADSNRAGESTAPKISDVPPRS